MYRSDSKCLQFLNVIICYCRVGYYLRIKKHLAQRHIIPCKYYMALIIQTKPTLKFLVRFLWTCHVHSCSWVGEKTYSLVLSLASLRMFKNWLAYVRIKHRHQHLVEPNQNDLNYHCDIHWFVSVVVQSVWNMTFFYFHYPTGNHILCYYYHYNRLN